MMKETHRVSGRAVILRDDAILLVNFGDYYNVPGGGVKPGEYLADCAVREVLEESGLTVWVEKALFTLEYQPQRPGDPNDPPHMSVFFHCTVDESIPPIPPTAPDHRLDDTSFQARAEWVPLSGLREITLVPDIPDNLLRFAETGEFAPIFITVRV